MKCYLGIEFGFHDSAAALVKDDLTILYASSEERFSRKKGDAQFPFLSVKESIAYARANSISIHGICIHENFLNKPQPSFLNIKFFISYFLKKIKRISTFIQHIQKLAESLDISEENIFFTTHHLSHAYTAIGTGAQSEGIVLVLDALGEKSCGLIGNFIGRKVINYQHFPYSKSLGLIYSAITVYCGFRVLTGEYKLMGLAPYGRPIYIDVLEQVFGNSLKNISIADLDIFSPQLVSKTLMQKLPYPPRRPNNQKIQQFYADLAASVQIFLESRVTEIIEDYLMRINQKTSFNLVLSGGVALNCKLNLYLSEYFGDRLNSLWIFPASGDAGSAVGACMSKIINDGNINNIKLFSSPYLGHKDVFHEKILSEHMINFAQFDDNELSRVCSRLKRGEIGGIFESRSEFGPRALGHRSIIGDPTNKNAVKYINHYIKSREDFRPLAPVMLESNAHQYMDLSKNSLSLYRYMLILGISKSYNSEACSLFKNRENDEGISTFDNTDTEFPATVHIDGTSRVQILHESSDALTLRQILLHMDSNYGVKALINTSMNVRGEPIVNTLDDALNCFKQTGLNFLIVNNSSVIYRDEQDPMILASFTNTVGLD